MGNSINKFLSASEDFRALEKVTIYLPNGRPEIDKIPSPKCQTILYQSAMEHLWGVEHFASFAVISETFRNSSFGANFLMNFVVDHQTIDLFRRILTPQKCMSLQFTHYLKIDADGCDEDISKFATRIVNTKYFHLQLQTLSLGHVDESLLWFFTGRQSSRDKWPQLRSLSLKSSSVCDVDLQNLPPRLTHLALNWCVNVTDTGLKAIATKLPALLTLDISYCFQVTDAGIKHISTGEITTLASLDVSGNNNVTDVGLQHLATGNFAKTLITLNLSGTSISDIGLKNIHLFSSLKAISLENCAKVTHVGVQENYRAWLALSHRARKKKKESETAQHRTALDLDSGSVSWKGERVGVGHGEPGDFANGRLDPGRN